MDIWSILGIAQTADKAAIQAAYRAKLTQTNPEDRPEEFKALRAAYEQALQLAKQAPAAKAAALTEGERWEACVAELYQDIAQRRDPDCWQLLLQQPFCMSLATRRQARDCLLRFLTGHYFLPQPIWRLFEDFFSLREHRDELLELFPRNFIEHAVFAGAVNDELLPYDALQGGGDACDSYLRSYGQFRTAMHKNDVDGMTQALAEMEGCGAQHPYTLLCRARLALASDTPDLVRASALAAQLNELLPGDLHAMMLAGDCAMRTEDWATAERHWNEVLSRYPDIAQAKFNLIECLIHLTRFFEAKELSLQLNTLLPSNPAVNTQLHTINRFVTSLREETLQTDPEDLDNIIELAWCYNQENRCAEALELLRRLPAGQMQGSYEYENLAAKVYLGNNLPAEALPHLQRWEEAIRLLPEDVENADRKLRLPEAVRLQAMVCEQLGQTAETDALYRTLEEHWPEDISVLQQRAQYALHNRDHDQALICAEALVRLSPSEAYSYYLLGTVLFHLHRRQEAYNAFNQAMQQAGRDAGCLMYQCRILMDVGQWDDAKKIVDDLTDAKIKGPVMDYILGRMAQHNSDWEEARRLFGRLAEICRKKGERYDFSGEVFFRLAGLRMENTPKDELLTLVEEGLRFDADSLSLLEMKADLLRQLDRIPEAIAALLRVIELAPRHRYIHESLGRLYHYCQRDYEKAVECYRTQLEIEETAVVHNLLGLALQELQHYEESRAAFEHAIALSPKDPAYIANLAGLYVVQNKLREAEVQYLHALELITEPNQNRILARLRRDLARIYFRMDRSDEGIRLLNDNVKELHEYSDLLTQAEACASCGQLSAALERLAQWRDLSGATECEYLHQQGNCYLKARQPRKALAAMRQAATNSIEAMHTLAVTHADLGHLRTAAALFRRLLRLDSDREDDHSWYAKTLLWAGQESAAKAMAAQGLTLLEQRKHELNKAMYYTRLAVYRTLLGEMNAARQALDAALAAPLCRFCSYSGCKDALWAEGFWHERAGRLEIAECIYAKGLEQYPDEFDFVAGLNRLKKRKQ